MLVNNAKVKSNVRTGSNFKQGEMTVFRAVETWLAARREEMAKEGENFLRSSKLEYWIWEYWNMNLKRRLRSSENTGY